MNKLFLLIFIFLATQSCSRFIGSSSKSKAGKTVTQVSEDELFLEEEKGLVIVDGEDDEIELEDVATRDVASTTDEILEYQSDKGETLIMIAVKIYGDYRKWKELYELNKDVVGADYDLSHGPALKFKRPKNPYQIPKGNPYLVKGGDSLSLISGKVYGNWRQWPVIHRNNSQVIRDPNLIFAGLTLYYPEITKQEIF